MTRRWQNLVHLKCPDCDGRMQRLKKGAFVCRDEVHEFYISFQTLARILGDPDHLAVILLTEHERKKVPGMIVLLEEMSHGFITPFYTKSGKRI